ncbi:tetratricopeptide repeat-containing sensor histidine kinase [Flavobacterium daemonense]|uniref:tetratricopeptide repeat-containing sensor histidine kinase n=1 Tax=Flavobacterium daemonense TaxID=1393049 RepID=UPI001184EC96|nr:tetratricopeptide repeat-containing sensor histidine kinase [Flavobacterium daemonense]KAF2326270.1 ATP-binding protein [Flavobacterium daemonense]
MAKNLLRFFQKNYIAFGLVVLFIALAFTFCMQFSEAKERQIKHIKKDRSIEIKQMQKKAFSFFDSGKFDSALFYFNKTQLLCVPKEDYPDEYVESLNYMVEILQRYGNYYEAETTLIKAFPYLEKTSNIKYAVNAYTFMGYNYMYTYDYEKALYYHKKALKKAVSTFRKSRILAEIAFVYMQQKKYQKAIDLLEPIVKYKIEDKITPSKTNYQRAAILYNLGLSYLRIGNHREAAFKCFKESQDLTFTLNDDYEFISNYYAFYLYYSKYYNPKLKKLNAEKAYYYAKKAKSAINETEMLANLIEADNAENSKKYWKVYIKKVDSLAISRKTAKNQFADIIYNSRKDRDENLELKTQKAERELELERQKNHNIILYISIVLVLSTLLFLFFRLSKKGKREKNEAIYISETRISKKLDAELANDLYHTINLIKKGNLEQSENKDQLLNNLENIYSKTRNISKENSFIITDENYISELKEMISGYKTNKVNILMQGFDAVRWNQIEKNKKIILYRVLQEVFLNMKKHSEATLVSTTFKIIEKNLIVTYADNGVGTANKNFILKNGLQNVENRIKTINGTITFDRNSDKGFRLSFTFPI